MPNITYLIDLYNVPQTTTITIPEFANSKPGCDFAGYTFDVRLIDHSPSPAFINRVGGTRDYHIMTQDRSLVGIYNFEVYAIEPTVGMTQSIQLFNVQIVRPFIRAEVLTPSFYLQDTSYMIGSAAVIINLPSLIPTPPDADLDYVYVLKEGAELISLVPAVGGF